LIDKKTGKNYVLEVNSSPGTQGLKKATNIDVVADIIDFIQDKENWVKSRMVVGFHEMISIPKVGEMVAKFDTGNGSLGCAMTYDAMKMEDDNKFVSWEIGKKKFKNKVIGYSNAVVGAETQKRTMIEMDIEFAGKLYTNVGISLVKRVDKSTPFLVNRTFMERIGCLVNPSKTFMVTTAPEDYVVDDAVGDPYGGIEFEARKKVSESQLFPDFDNYLNKFDSK
jgi:hypothetical protein